MLQRYLLSFVKESFKNRLDFVGCFQKKQKMNKWNFASFRMQLNYFCMWFWNVCALFNKNNTDYCYSCPRRVNSEQLLPLRSTRKKTTTISNSEVIVRESIRVPKFYSTNLWLLFLCVWKLEQTIAAAAKTFKTNVHYWSKLSMYWKIFACAR